MTESWTEMSAELGKTVSNAFGYDEYNDAADAAGDAVSGLVAIGVGIQVVLIVFSLCYWLLIPCLCFYDLWRRDSKLPPLQKCMDCGMIFGYWALCFCFGCIGSSIFYCFAAQEIGRRQMMVSMQQNQPVNVGIVMPQAQYAPPPQNVYNQPAQLDTIDEKKF